MCDVRNCLNLKTKPYKLPDGSTKEFCMLHSPTVSYHVPSWEIKSYWGYTENIP